MTAINSEKDVNDLVEQSVLQENSNVIDVDIPDAAPASSLASKFEGKLSKETAEALLNYIDELKGDYP